MSSTRKILGGGLLSPPSTVEISGYVRLADETGIEGVSMTGLTGTPSTNVDGYYEATVDYNWTGTVTPTKTGYTFTPVNKSYSGITANQVNQNYVGISYSEEVLADSPWRYYKLDEESGDFADSSGNGGGDTTIPYVNGITQGVDPLISVGKSVSSNGANSAVLYSPVQEAGWDTLLNSDYTIELWWKSGTNTTDTDTLFGLEFNNAWYWFAALNGTAGAGNTTISFRAGGNSQNIAKPLLDNTAHHLVFVYDHTADQMTLHIDGDGGTAFTAFNPGACPGMAANEHVGWLAMVNNTTNITGELIGGIDEIALYASKLSNARIAAHYAAGTAT